VYDQDGQLLGEYNSAGTPLREYVWLGNTPVAIFTPDPANATNPPLVYYVHTDHLNAPRLVTDKANNVRWRWLAEPFGTTAPEDNPSALGAFTQNLRFPGQFADSESGLSYNYFRNYDASIGRYNSSDPIGLNGGVNTYAYVSGKPLSHVDPRGLDDANPFGPLIPPGGVPAAPPENCPEEKCSNPVTVTFTVNNVCAQGDTQCAQAMKAAGLQGPYFPRTVTGTYSATCLAKLGIGVKGTAAVAGQAAGKYLPGAAANGLSRVGLPVAGAYVGAAGTTIAEISSGPIGIAVSVVGALSYLEKECKCEGAK
jgi:RHS repeat-associated protein